MKKKIALSVCLSIVVFLIISSILVTNGIGAKTYHINTLNSDIKIPKYSYFVDELEGEDTYQLEFIMFGKEEHIIQQLNKLYVGDDNSITGYKFMDWCVNDKKTHKSVIVVYEKQ